jgi:hypothetical protein
MIEWPKEDIPDTDFLYMRVHEMWRRNGSVSPGAFKNHGRGMSTDWSEYATPVETRARAKIAPEKNAVVKMNVGDVCSVPGQTVEHTPDEVNDNRAHTDVLGEKDEEARVKLRRISTVVLSWSQ